MKKILVSGSIAFDRVKKFNGHFNELLLPENLSTLSISFVVDSMTEHDGGVAANIAFGFGLLGEKATIIGSVGKDFSDYNTRLSRFSDTSLVQVFEKEFTAVADIVTDHTQNQITTFFPGALQHAFFGIVPNAEVALVSAGNKQDMVSLPMIYRENGTPFFFDPGQMTSALSSEELTSGMVGAIGVMVNEYEWGIIQKKTGWSEKDVLTHAKCLVVTQGKRGSRVITNDGEIFVEAVTAAAVDPSGAGDAYRAGFVYGFLQKKNFKECAQLGATLAAFAVESEGMQNHECSFDEIKKRYESSYGQGM